LGGDVLGLLLVEPDAVMREPELVEALVPGVGMLPPRGEVDEGHVASLPEKAHHGVGCLLPVGDHRQAVGARHEVNRPFRWELLLYLLRVDVPLDELAVLI